MELVDNSPCLSPRHRRTVDLWLLSQLVKSPSLFFWSDASIGGYGLPLAGTLFLLEGLQQGFNNVLAGENPSIFVEKYAGTDGGSHPRRLSMLPCVELESTNDGQDLTCRSFRCRSEHRTRISLSFLRQRRRLDRPSSCVAGVMAAGDCVTVARGSASHCSFLQRCLRAKAARACPYRRPRAAASPDLLRVEASEQSCWESVPPRVRFSSILML